ncbi:conserved hypothetical protein [Burkholderia sp. H160]|nr:conserved hypothetical protein [Burkholderia sp. H160]
MTTIYEPLYLDGQTLSEPAFKPLPVDNSQAAWREVRILVDFWRRGGHRAGGFVGIFSPKFGLKTKVPAERFLSFVAGHANADVCLINPFPQLSYYSFNVWMQGEANHPGLMERSQALLDAVEMDWNLSATPRNDARTLSYSNFWVGTEQFWDEYIGGIIEPIARFLEQNPDHDVARSVMDATYHSDPAPFLPFIVERLLSAFLAARADLSVAAYPIEDVEPYLTTPCERELVELMKPLVDSADASGVFSEDLRKMQEHACQFLVLYSKVYYETSAHPHTCRTITPA